MTLLALLKTLASLLILLTLIVIIKNLKFLFPLMRKSEKRLADGEFGKSGNDSSGE